jgi:SH3 domain protein
VNKKTTIFFILVVSFSAQAKTVYVTDQLNVNIRSGQSTQNKIVEVVSSGMPLKVLSKNPATGYLKVRTNAGTIGFLLARYTLEKPIARQSLAKAQENLALLNDENTRLKTELASIQKKTTTANNNNKSLSEERNQLDKDLTELRQTSSNAIQLKNERDQLQERVVNVTREKEQLERENQALQDSAEQDWFLYGGILAFAGIFLGLIIPKLSWPRKNSNWDTF